MPWEGTANIGSRSYRCGYCGNIVASAIGYYKKNSALKVYICPHCERPSYFDKRDQVPGIAPGNEVENLPDHIASLYREARYCVSVSAYTASVLACRKLLMNIAVAQGAQEGYDAGQNQATHAKLNHTTNIPKRRSFKSPDL